MKYLQLLVMGIAGLICIQSVSAETLEYTLAPNPHPTVQGQWMENSRAGDKRQAANIIARLQNVELRLKIPASYSNPPSMVKIFLHFPSQVVGVRDSRGVKISWLTRGRFLSGRARPGERVLLYEGSVDSSELSDIIDFTFIVDGGAMTGDFQFEPIYEIESK